MYIKKIKSVLFNPSVFFKNVSREKGVKSSFGYFALLSAFATVLSFILFSLFPSLYMSIPKILGFNYPEPFIPGFGLFLILSALGYVLSLAFSFLWGAILHVWIMIFGGEGKYSESYNLYIYAITPRVLLSWIPFISFFGWFWEVGLLIIGTQKVYGFSKTKAVLMYLIPALIYVIIVIAFYVFVSFVLKNSMPIDSSI